MQASELWKLYASGESTVQVVKGVNVNIGEGNDCYYGSFGMW